MLWVLFFQVQSSLTAKELESYGEAGAVVEEVLSSMRTVVAFGGEDKEVARLEFLWSSQIDFTNILICIFEERILLTKYYPLEFVTLAALCKWLRKFWKSIVKNSYDAAWKIVLYN